MKYRILLTFLFLQFSAFAQTPYGNDWINFSQTYYKIKITEDGVYRINQGQLTALGIPLAGINPKNFQLFHKGIEVAVYIEGEADNSFDPADFIEFFGEKNNGKLDKDLYNNPADQPHDYYSLYSDTSAYFLTWSTAPGKRYNTLSLPPTALVAEPYFMWQAVSYFIDGGYYPGAYILAETSLSEYTEGEGILGSTLAIGGQQTKALATPGLFTGTADPIVAEVYVAGRSDAASTHPTNLNHHLRIDVSPSNTIFSTKKDELYKGYAVVKSTFNLPALDIGTNTYFKLSSINDIGAATDFQAPGYIKLSYPRKYDLNGLQNLKFTLRGIQPASNSFLKFANSGLTAPIILDLTNERRIIAQQNLGNLEAVVPGAGTNKELFLYDSPNFKPTVLTPVSFVNLNPATSDKDFLIITHQSLLNKAQEYAAYRNSTGYKTLVITTDQLYDQFYYGVHHPLSIRNFSKFLLDKAVVKPKYLLLLGKGQSHYYLRGGTGSGNGGKLLFTRQSNVTLSSTTDLTNDLVPSIGNPPSDNLFTSGLDGTNWEPAIVTGRIAAKTNAEVADYLQKLIAYERQPESLWRKNIIHVSGGNTLLENISWSSYQKNFETISADEFFGSKTITFKKQVNEPVTDNLRQRIVNEIDKGSSLLSYFGHGSAQALEINVGEPAELQNQDKLLIYLLNGCNAGNPFTENSLGEKLILQPQKGAIGWLATTDEGVASYLGSFSTKFYQNSFKTNYGNSIAENLKQTIKDFQSPGDLLNQSHSRQYLLQGDPALKFYSPAKPDYYIENRDLFIYPENTNAFSDSFAVAIVVKNQGKALNQPLSISIKRTLPDNTVITYPSRIIAPVLNTDTLYYYIKSKDNKTAGSNKFQVSVDADLAWDELNETNNTAELNFLMPVNGVNILYPKQYSIVHQPIQLKAQSSNLFIKNGEYIFEMDTVKTFDSPWKKSSGVLTLGFMPVWTPNMTPENNRVYYWRVRFNLPEDQGGLWQESSFTYIASSPDGWNQGHFQQFGGISAKNVLLNSANRRFEFSNTTFKTSIQTRGDDAPTTDERTYRSEPGGRLAFHGWEFPGISIIALDNVHFDKRLSYPSPHNYVNTTDDVIGYTGQYFWDLNNAAQVDSMIRYIGQIPNGFYVVGFNGKNLDLKNLPVNAKNALKTLGLTIFENVNPGEAYMFWGQKGTAPGSAVERTGGHNELIKFEKEYYYPFTEGYFVSEKAGPSQKWGKAFYNFDTETSDQLTVSVIGVKQDGQESPLITNAPANTVDLNTIDAETYPYLRLKAELKDETNRTPAQLKNWKILYDEYPEGTGNPDLKHQFYSPTVQEGDSIRWELAYQNISAYPLDSVQVYYTLTKADRSTITQLYKTFPPLTTGQSITTNLKLPTLGLVGNNQIKLEFLPKNRKDSYAFNNILAQNFVVERDIKEPIIDVVFDGKHILNNEIVSPSPTIMISSLDENEILLLNDTTVLDISLKKQEENQFKRISYSSNKLIFTAATTGTTNKAIVNYKPETLADGIYTLRVRAKDKTGNFTTANAYLIDFEVINESTVTHFYPYPNPFTTSMKFVFTLTGAKIPDKLKIQILTLSGKVVREILKEELGNLRIGNNISDFSWDGTDQFGDKLANGVYFYRVLVENEDHSDFKHRRTQGDKYFKNETGKIYLMR